MLSNIRVQPGAVRPTYMLGGKFIDVAVSSLVSEYTSPSGAIFKVC
jgi:hypothetical protein